MRLEASNLRVTSPRWPQSLDAVTVGRILVPVVLVALWQLLALIMGDFYVATPAASIEALIEGGWLGEDLETTVSALGYGYALAAAGGLAIGVTLGLSRFAYAVFEPIVVSLWALPKVALYPVFLLLFGFGIEAQAWFAMTFGVFPIAAFAMHGTRNVRPVLLKVGRSLRLGPLRTFRSVVFPAALPSILTGLRLGFGITFLGVILGEMFAGNAGTGFLLIQNVRLHDTPRVYALTALLTCIALVVNVLFLYLERRITHRRPTPEVAF